MTYQCKAAQATNPDEIHKYYLELFKKSREREFLYGSTLYGPHRDELEIRNGDQEVRSFGSEGQKRTCATMLRLSSWELLKKRVEEPPLLLIDDIGVSLDDKRRQRLMEHLFELGQVFVTSAQPLSVQKDTPIKYFEIEAGTIQDISTSILSPL